VNHQSKIIEEVLAERVSQDVQWGEQNHNPFCYLTVLMEEVGEASKAALELRFGTEYGTKPDTSEYRKELVQVAAVAIAMIECIDRNKWRWLHHDHNYHRKGE